MKYERPPSPSTYGKARVPPPIPRPQPLELPSEKRPKPRVLGPLESAAAPATHFCGACGAGLMPVSRNKYVHRVRTECKGTEVLYTEKPWDIARLLLLKPDADWREDWRLRLEKYCYGCRHYVTSSAERTGDILFRCDLSRRSTGAVGGLRPTDTCPTKELAGDIELSSWWTPSGLLRPQEKEDGDENANCQ
jgi:hypothetical protein